MHLDPARYIKISRPKFWLYLLGPYFLGAVLAVRELGQLERWQFILLFLWFTLPANLLLYGINDVFDYDTDRYNPKKEADEALVTPDERAPLLCAIALLFLIAVPVLIWSNSRVRLTLLGFMALSVAYSAPPFRLKARPLLDSFSNMLYLAPLLVGWFLFSGAVPPAPLIAAGIAWCMAMHAYSAVPDIDSDKMAGLSTVATLLGRDTTLLFCGGLYLAASLITGYFDAFVGAALFVYPVAMAAQLLLAPSEVGRWYRYFPALNALAGMLLTLRFLYPLAA